MVGYPRLVFCIPQEHTSLWKSYEDALTISTVEGANSTKTKPKFIPMILDIGYLEGAGFDTIIAFCYKIKHPNRIYLINVTDSNLMSNATSLRPIGTNSTFLDMYLSFSEDRFLDWQKAVWIFKDRSYELNIENLAVNEYKRRGNKYHDKYPVGEKDMPEYYNQAYCLDVCVHGRIMEYSSNGTIGRY